MILSNLSPLGSCFLLCSEEEKISAALGVPREAVHAAQKPGDAVAAAFILRFPLQLKSLEEEPHFLLLNSYSTVGARPRAETNYL